VNLHAQRSKVARAASIAAPITSGWLQLNSSVSTPSSAATAAASATGSPERRRGTSSVSSSFKVNDSQNGLPSCGRPARMARASTIELWVSQPQVDMRRQAGHQWRQQFVHPRRFEQVRAIEPNSGGNEPPPHRFARRLHRTLCQLARQRRQSLPSAANRASPI
jgi:hypothetical protein